MGDEKFPVPVADEWPDQGERQHRQRQDQNKYTVLKCRSRLAGLGQFKGTEETECRQYQPDRYRRQKIQTCIAQKQYQPVFGASRECEIKLVQRHACDRHPKEFGIIGQRNRAEYAVKNKNGDNRSGSSATDRAGRPDHETDGQSSNEENNRSEIKQQVTLECVAVITGRIDFVRAKTHLVPAFVPQFHHRPRH